MFLRAEDLKLSYGVDLQIARCYVNRMVPVENAYWKGRHLYIPPVPGFMFMPIMSDLARRCGVQSEWLLSERYLSSAEFILNSAARLEMRQIDWSTHVRECLDHARVDVCQPKFLSSLDRYLSAGSAVEVGKERFGTPFPSLNRADTYLISFSAIPFDETITPNLLDAWYALMTFFLLQDDLSDIRQDLKNHEENALLDAGLSEDGAARIRTMIRQSQSAVEKINPILANRIECSDQTMDIEGLIRKILEEMSDTGRP
jgi:hypothetical protein